MAMSCPSFINNGSSAVARATNRPSVAIQPTRGVMTSTGGSGGGGFLGGWDNEIIMAAAVMALAFLRK